MHMLLYGRKRDWLLTAKNSPIKYDPEILRQLKAVDLPREVAVLHCREHQLNAADIARGNSLTNRTARRAAMSNISIIILVPHALSLPEKLQYTSSENFWAEEQGFTLNSEGWSTRDQELLLPAKDQLKIIKAFHDSLHLGWDATLSGNQNVSGRDLSQTIKRVTQACTTLLTNREKREDAHRS